MDFYSDSERSDLTNIPADASPETFRRAFQLRPHPPFGLVIPAYADLQVICPPATQ